MAKEFYAPVLISGVEDSQKGIVDIHITNDRQETISGQVIWTIFDVQGGLVEKGKIPATIPPRQNVFVDQLQLGDYLEEYGARQLLVQLDFQEAGRTISKNTVLFVRPKHLELQAPDIKVFVQEMDDHQYQVQLKSALPALWIWLEIEGGGARFSKNFFHLLPGKRETGVIIYLEDMLSAAELKDRPQVRSLTDTYE